MGLSFEPGEVLCAKYRVEGLLGTGGMGIVIAAEHIQLGERVALKILRPDLVHDPRLVGRFEREARAAAKIRSEHVARVSDVGRLESGLPFMVMEYLHGCDLGAHLKQHGALQLPEAADYVLQACEAIAEAHALGIVHRDLKPENLFLTTRPDGSYSIKVLDFGISKVAWLGGSSSDNAAVPRGMMGSPLYMSPEQLRSASDVDARADVWALGVILFELLTRETPFVADTLPQLCTAILEAEPIPLASYRSDLPAPVGALIAACLQKACADRIASVADFARRLAELGPPHARLSAERIARIAAGGAPARHPRATDSPPVTPVTPAPVTPGTPVTPATPAAVITPRQRPPVRAIAFAALTALAGAGLIAWLQPCASAPAASGVHLVAPSGEPIAPRPSAPPAQAPAAPELPAGVVSNPQTPPAAIQPVAPTEHRISQPSRVPTAAPSQPARAKPTAERKRAPAKQQPAPAPLQQRSLGGRI